MPSGIIITSNQMLITTILDKCLSGPQGSIQTEVQVLNVDGHFHFLIR